MTDTQYEDLCHVCDEVLQLPGAPPAVLATHWLHIVNEHPDYAKFYEHLFVPPRYPARQWPVVQVFRKHFERLAVREPAAGWNASIGSGDRYDVVLVSWLVNPAHLDQETDFYLGSLQQELSTRGLRVLRILRNQTGTPGSKLVDKLKSNSDGKTILLPDRLSYLGEAEILSAGLAARRWLRRHAEKRLHPLAARVASSLKRHVTAEQTIGNLRLIRQLRRIMKQTRPSAVVTLLEGFAWERCVWRTARELNPHVRCVGYQHTNLRKRSHAIRRFIGGGCDPDTVLTSGSHTRSDLERHLPDSVRFITFGSHRASGNPATGSHSRLEDVLVLPEGIESECIRLFDFALACAEQDPDRKFIFRTHPVLPFDRVRSKLQRDPDHFRNVEISQNASIQTDFGRCGVVLFRGSSSVLYAIQAGLKPIYFDDGSMNIDPVYELDGWRENVRSAGDWVELTRRHRDSVEQPDTAAEFDLAQRFCASYTIPVQQSAIDELAELLKSRN